MAWRKDEIAGHECRVSALCREPGHNMQPTRCINNDKPYFGVTLTDIARQFEDEYNLAICTIVITDTHTGNEYHWRDADRTWYKVERENDGNTADSAEHNEA